VLEGFADERVDLLLEGRSTRMPMERPAAVGRPPPPFVGSAHQPRPTSGNDGATHPRQFVARSRTAP